MESTYNELVEILSCLCVYPPLNQEDMYKHYSRIASQLRIAREKLVRLEEVVESLKEGWKDPRKAFIDY